LQGDDTVFLDLNPIAAMFAPSTAAFPSNNPTTSYSHPLLNLTPNQLTLWHSQTVGLPSTFLAVRLEWNVLGLGSDTEVLVQHKNDGFCNKICPGSGYVKKKSGKVTHPGGSLLEVERARLEARSL
jgi:hypothetical protein